MERNVMIGAIIQGVNDEGEFDPLIYHQFGKLKESVVEMTARHALHCPNIHKVIVAMPPSERRRCSELNLRRGRKQSGQWSFNFAVNTLDLIYETALDYSLDHIIRIRANCPLIPPWLIGKIVKRYFAEGSSQFAYSLKAEPAFLVEVFPFWMLADAWTYTDTKERNNFTKPWFEDDSVITQPGEWINSQKLNLRFDNLDQLSMWDYLIEGMNKGLDIEDLIEEYAKNGDSFRTI
jgi:spore coat polysaccharide biosynthesis protein SpsF (cytidylyltransferase family)